MSDTKFIQLLKKEIIKDIPINHIIKVFIAMEEVEKEKKEKKRFV